MAYEQRTKPSRKPLNIILRIQKENILKTKEKIKRRAKVELGTSQQMQQRNMDVFTKGNSSSLRIPASQGSGRNKWDASSERQKAQRYFHPSEHKSKHIQKRLE